MRTTGGVNRAHEIVSLRTELHEAARTGRLQLVALLIKQGALLEAADEDGLTPLHEAVRAGAAGTTLRATMRIPALVTPAPGRVATGTYETS